MSRYLALALAAALLLTAFAAPRQATAADSGVAAPDIVIRVDGQRLQLPVPPYVVQGTTLVPLRPVFTALGASVDWDDASRTVTASRGSRTITLTIGAAQARIGRVPISLRLPARIEGGRTLVPIRFVSEALGAAVAWDGAARRIDITALDTDPAPPPGATPAAIAHVSSGDALLTDAGTPLRLAGVAVADNDRPVLSAAAEAYTRGIVAGQTVYVTDAAPPDAYGRRQVNLWLADGQLLQAALVHEGYAQVLDGNPALLTLQAEAQALQRGRWGMAATGPGRIYEGDAVRLVSRVQGGRLTLRQAGTWQPRFWRGINLGATKPGFFPGELPLSRDEYLRWFGQMKELHLDAVRVYTLLPPAFYAALADFNAGRQGDPLWLYQGVWAPEELMFVGGRAQDVYTAPISTAMGSEVEHVVRAVHGDLLLAPSPGHASGTYTADVSAYLIGWIAGVEWDPHVVVATNAAHAGEPAYAGTYFAATAGASPFESWLARLLDGLAGVEMRYGWQHPAAFVDWVTTDPLHHPNEPLSDEDLVSVDPTHLAPTVRWQAGYFASYHVYPYYPEMLRFTPEYQTYKDATGQVNPYAAYLHDLRAYHAGLPLVISEFGVPTSRGMAHKGPQGWDQGMHDEAEQGRIDAAMLASIWSEDLDGATLFSWQDEWFKVTWNTQMLALPPDRRPLWDNRLTNEQHFGLLSFDPGPADSALIHLDGRTDDWDRHAHVQTAAFPGVNLGVTHDAAYVYLLLTKPAGSWDWHGEQLDIGFSTLPGGATQADLAPGVSFGQGSQFLLQIRGPSDAHLSVLSAYDQHVWYWGEVQSELSVDPRWREAANGIFLPWKLTLMSHRHLPQTGEDLKLEEVEIGVLHEGNTDPADPGFNSLADWYASGNVLEVRLPWQMLGFTDPSSRQVWDYPFAAHQIRPVSVSGLGIEPHLHAAGAVSGPQAPLVYTWDKWDVPSYHERLKAAYPILQQALPRYALPHGVQPPG